MAATAAAGSSSFFPPPPAREVRWYEGAKREKSLGTTALREKMRWDSNSDSDAATAPRLVPSMQKPWFPPPPPPPATAPMRKVKIVERKVALQPLPVLPEMVIMPSPVAESPQEKGSSPTSRKTMTTDGHQLPRKPLARAKSKRVTIMHFIDGWWDLGLLEQERKKSLMRAASRKV